jgi:hypothetical protein
MKLSKFEQSTTKIKKMKKILFLLVFAIPVFLLLLDVSNSDHVKSSALEVRQENENKLTWSWIPSDLIVNLKKKFPYSHQLFHGRALSLAKTANESLPLEKTKLQTVSTNTTAVTRKTRTNDSYQRHSGKLISYGTLTSLLRRKKFLLS